MEKSRWLLPFTSALDMGAIDLVIDLAERVEATLIGVSLISEHSLPRLRSMRLEQMQQSKDFLEALRWKAERYKVHVERHEVFTADVMQHIPLLVADLHCDAIILVTTGEREVFLQAHELKSLLEHAPSQLLIIRMAPSQEQEPPRSWLQRFMRKLPWHNEFQNRSGDVSLGQADVSETVDSSWIRVEG